MFKRLCSVADKGGDEFSREVPEKVSDTVNRWQHRLLLLHTVFCEIHKH